MMMKKYLSLILLLSILFIGKINAQSSSNSLVPINLDVSTFFAPIPIGLVYDYTPSSNYHFFNPYLFNPAMAGIENKSQLNLDYNRQISNSFNISYEQPISSINSAVGLSYNFRNDPFGKVHQFSLAYNYSLIHREKTKLNLGVQFSQVSLWVGEESVLPKSWEKNYALPTFDFGLAFQHKKLRLGASIQNLFPSTLKKDKTNSGFITDIEMNRKLNLSAAQTFKIFKRWDWSLAVLLQFSEDTEFVDFNDFYGSRYYYYEYDFDKKNSHDFSSYISFNKIYTIGTTYRRHNESVWIGFVGLKLKEKLNLQFSFNMKKNSDENRFWELLSQYEF